MADIPIYGKLRNDTDGIIVDAEQVRDNRTGRTLTETLDLIELSSGSVQPPSALSPEEILDIANNV